MENYDRQPIFKIYIAQQLLKSGNPIVDIQKDKHDCKRTVFFFDKTQKFYQDWKYLRDREDNK